jgi:lysophospholipase L1-like esterase
MVAVLAQLLSGLSLSRAEATTATTISAGDSGETGPDEVWVVGDSITARSRARLRDRLRRSVARAVYIDGVGGRNVSTLDELVSQRIRRGATDAMVLALGTNSSRSWSKADYLRAVDAIPESTAVVLVTVYKSHSAATATPAVLRRMADYSRWMREIASARSNVCVADWRKAASREPRRLLEDGVHPSAAGKAVWVSLVGRAVEACS